MKMLVRFLRGVALSIVAVLLGLWVLGRALPVERLARLVQTAALGGAGWSIRSQEVSTSSGIGLALQDVMIENAKGKPVMALDELSVNVPIMPLLWLQTGAEVRLLDRRGGSLEAAVRATPLGYGVDLEAEQFPYTFANYFLDDYGARITGALDLQLHASSPLASPGALTGTVSVKSENIHIVGGPLLAGFGMGELDIPGLSGRQAIEGGKLDKLEILVDGDALYGSLELGLTVPPELNGLQWEFVPHLKFDTELQAKLTPVLPLSGLRKDPKGYWSRNFRGKF